MSTTTQTTIYTDATVNGVKRTYYNKEYFDKKLLETAKTKLVHASFGMKKSIPGGRGKKIEMRRRKAFDPATALGGLVEGKTPDSWDLNQEHVEATCKQYGAFVEVSDLMLTTAYDDVLRDATEGLGEAMGIVIEHVTRNIMCSGTNVQYAGGRSSRLTITGTDKLTVAEIRKAVRTLKKQKARMFTRSEDGQKSRRPHFVCICSPDATYDLQSDALWQDVSKYSNAEQIYTGEIGRLFGVVFVESTEAKVFKQTVLNAVNANVTSGSTFVLKNDPSEAAAAFFSTAGKTFKAGSLTLTTKSYAAATKTVTVDETFSATDKLDADDIVWSEDAGACDGTTKAGLDVHATLVFGEAAYGLVDIAGKGSIETIIHKDGSTTDPLNQRVTVGAKCGGYTACILNNAWLVRIEHAVSA